MQEKPCRFQTIQSRFAKKTGNSSRKRQFSRPDTQIIHNFETFNWHITFPRGNLQPKQQFNFGKALRIQHLPPKLGKHREHHACSHIQYGSDLAGSLIIPGAPLPHVCATACPRQAAPTSALTPL
jgi:hypothetical protein